MLRLYTNDEVKQGTPEWHKLREGLLTGTDAYDILQNKSYDSILMKKQNNNFQGNYYTRRGHILEDEAREIYSQVYNKVFEYGFIKNDKYPKCGYSPDGIIRNLDHFDKSGLWECKAFNENRHWQVYVSLDAHVLAQVQFGLLITELPWCDLILYNPDVDDIDKRFLVRRVEPILDIQDKLKKYLEKL